VSFTTGVGLKKTSWIVFLAHTPAPSENVCRYRVSDLQGQCWMYLTYFEITSRRQQDGAGTGYARGEGMVFAQMPQIEA
jgi:hypothetical protein